MNSTTTCENFQPWITNNPTVGNPKLIKQPDANNQNFQWGTTTCVTVSDGSSTPASTTQLSGDGQAVIYAFGIMIFIALLFFFKDIFDVKRYDWRSCNSSSVGTIQNTIYILDILYCNLCFEGNYIFKIWQLNRLSHFFLIWQHGVWPLGLSLLLRSLFLRSRMDIAKVSN